MDTLISNRLVEMTFKPVSETAHWLRRLGLEADAQSNGAVRVHNPHLNITTAILDNSDPVTQATCLATAFFGPYWPQVAPGLLKAVDREWKRQRKTRKEQEEKAK